MRFETNSLLMDNKNFIEKVGEKAGIGKQECSLMINAFAELLESTLASGDSISIPSFGNFDPHKRNERIMTHPSRPGQRLLVPPKVVVSFKPSAILKNKINSDNGSRE